jgi:hypothetical protein
MQKPRSKRGRYHRRHALDKLRKRFNAGCDVLEYLLARARRGQGKNKRKRGARVICDIEYRGTTYEVVYSNKTKEIVTVRYPREAGREFLRVVIVEAMILRGVCEILIPRFDALRTFDQPIDDLPPHVAHAVITGARELGASGSRGAQTFEELSLDKWSIWNGTT